jgi:hypothetical protein
MPKIRKIDGENAGDTRNRLENKERRVKHIKQQPEIIKQKALHSLKKNNNAN